MFHFCIQLFPQSLSLKRVKEYATRSQGIVGSDSLWLLINVDGVSAPRKRKYEYPCLSACLPACLSSVFTLKPSTRATVKPHQNFQHCCVYLNASVEQLFSKQL